LGDDNIGELRGKYKKELEEGSEKSKEERGSIQDWLD
jgi:hypothetical protein